MDRALPQLINIYLFPYIVQVNTQHLTHASSPSEFSSAIQRHFTVKIARASKRARQSFYRNRAVSSPGDNNNGSCAPVTTTMIVPPTPKSPTLTPGTFELPSSEFQFIDDCDHDSQQLSDGVTQPRFLLPEEDRGKNKKQRFPIGK